MVAGALHDADGPCWWLDLDPVAKALKLHHPNGELSLGVPVDTDRWTALEVGWNSVGDEMKWWVNGRPAGVAPLEHTPAGIDHVWLGAAYPSIDTGGEFSLDEWAIDESYLGPLVVAPEGAFADDLRRWLVTYHAGSADSAGWAEDYRRRRGVPHANFLGVEAPTQETITFNEFELARGQIDDYLDRHALGEYVLGILLGPGTPGFVTDPDLGTPVPLASMLQAAGDGFFTVDNSVAQVLELKRPTVESLSGVRLTARIDGPTPAASTTLLDRADAVSSQRMESRDRLWIDRFPDDGVYSGVATTLIDWMAGPERQQLRLPIQQATGPSTDASDHDNVTRDAFYWGWAGPSVPEGFFGENPGPRAVFGQMRLSSDPGTSGSLRQTSATNWAEAALSEGYAAVIAASRNDSLVTVPRPGPFFEALRRGWTLAEAWILALPLVRTAYFIVGDPLMTVSTPLAGWSVYGPLQDASEFDPGRPLAVLPESQTSLTLPQEARPSASESLWYLVRRSGRDGQTETAFRPVGVGRVGDETAPAATPLAWPTREGWGVERSGDSLYVHAVLFPRLNANQSLTLLLESDDGVEPRQVSTADRATVVTATTPTPMPTQTVRFRWRVVTASASIWLSPWSRAVTPATTLGSPLTLLER
ncbi:MAG: hypothetical protein AAFX76_02085 [Planctomycetota bacterium]